MLSKEGWNWLLTIVALLLAVVSLLVNVFGGFAPVWETRPTVLNFPEPTLSPPLKNVNVMPRQFTREQKRFLHERRGPVINFPNYGPPGMQPPVRPDPEEGEWWGYREEI